MGENTEFRGIWRLGIPDKLFVFYKLLTLKISGGRRGTEPPVQLLTVQRFSKPPPSATRPSLRALRLYRNPISSARTTLLQHEMSLQGASIARLPARRQKREARPQVLWHLKISARQLRRRRTVSLRPIGVFEFPLLLTNTRLLFPLKLRSAVPDSIHCSMSLVTVARLSSQRQHLTRNPRSKSTPGIS